MNSGIFMLVLVIAVIAGCLADANEQDGVVDDSKIDELFAKRQLDIVNALQDTLVDVLAARFAGRAAVDGSTDPINDVAKAIFDNVDSSVSKRQLDRLTKVLDNTLSARSVRKGDAEGRTRPNLPKDPISDVANANSVVVDDDSSAPK